VPSVEWKWDGGGKESLQLPTINVGVHLVGSLKALLEIFLLTSLKYLKNLPVVKMSADDLWT
jgi:hypothetical protein